MTQKPLLVATMAAAAGLAGLFPVTTVAADPQIYITSKFIETDDTSTADWLAKHAKSSGAKSAGNFHVLSDPQFQFFIRQVSQTKGADILTAPSVVAKLGQAAKIEVIREVIYPASHGGDSVNVETLNRGVTLEVDSILVDDGISLLGKAIIREFDDADESAEKGDTFERWVTPDTPQPFKTPRAPFALSFNTLETVFGSTLPDGHTLVMICRRSEKVRGNLIIAVTARKISPEGKAASVESPRAPGNIDPLATTLKVSAFHMTGTVDGFSSRDPELPEASDQTDESAAAVPSLAGVFSIAQFEALCHSLEDSSSAPLRELASHSVAPGGRARVKSGAFITDVRPVINVDGTIVDLDLAPRLKGVDRQGSLPRISISMYTGHWLMVSFPPHPGAPARTLFLQVDRDEDSSGSE